MTIVEKADGSRRMMLNRLFPRSWGDVPYDDEERHAWIARHAIAEASMKPQRELARRDTKLVNELRRMHLERLRDCP